MHLLNLICTKLLNNGFLIELLFNYFVVFLNKKTLKCKQKNDIKCNLHKVMFLNFSKLGI